MKLVDVVVEVVKVIVVVEVVVENGSRRIVD